MKIRTNLLGALIVTSIFGLIGITFLAELWTTESEKIPASYTTGEFEGAYNPADIRGSYTFEEVSNLFGIDLPVLYEAFQIPEEAQGSELKSKDIEGLYADSGYQIGNESLQVFVALYKKLPIILDDSYLPESASELIKKANLELTEEQLEYLAVYTIRKDAISIKQDKTISTEIADASIKTDNNVTVAPAKLENEKMEAPDKTDDEEPKTSVETESVINGAATFQMALDAGITIDEIEEIIQGPMPLTNMKIKDYCTEKGLSFSEIKEKLNTIINNN